LGNAHTLQATIAETNTASRRTAERAGFQLIGKSDETCPNGDSQEHGLTYQLSI
jgi:RimJ/RimL family protein N-acetyltransferase